MESPIYFLVVQKKHMISDNTTRLLYRCQDVECICLACSFDAPLRSQSCANTWQMPPNVKPKVIHYFMSKEKNFTLNQPWRLS